MATGLEFWARGGRACALPAAELCCFKSLGRWGSEVPGRGLHLGCVATRGGSTLSPCWPTEALLGMLRLWLLLGRNPSHLPSSSAGGFCCMTHSLSLRELPAHSCLGVWWLTCLCQVPAGHPGLTWCSSSWQAPYHTSSQTIFYKGGFPFHYESAEKEERKERKEQEEKIL